jgi:hypothetical protein
MKHFRISFLVTIFCLILASWWGYQNGGIYAAATALGIAVILGIMEVSLSFDNAVVNASVLKNWDPFWQNIFLTIGMLIAVFGMRLIFPLVIVSLAADLGFVEVWNLAIDNPRAFSSHLTEHHDEVAVFGGIFLLLVALNFLFDETKEMHWLGNFEKKIASFGKISSVPMLIAMIVIVGITGLVENDKQFVVLLSGIWGLIVYVGVDFISSILESDEAEESEKSSDIGKVIKSGSIGGFLYLEILDASFSFDGVIGAFAITNDIVIIMLGLTIGAMFVRSLTVYLVRQGTLDEYVFLEHGAHYAIGILALIMFISIKHAVPELVTGLIGFLFIFASLVSSIRYRKEQNSIK